MGSIRRKAHQLPQRTQQRSAFQRGDGTLQGMGSIHKEALTPPCHDTPQNSERTSGAMERYMRGFDSRGTGGNVAEGSKGEHSAPQVEILL